MPLTREQVLARIRQLSKEINELIDDLGKMGPLPAAGARANPNICPIHNVAWINTQQGQSHKLTDGSGKWCSKNKLAPPGKV